MSLGQLPDALGLFPIPDHEQSSADAESSADVLTAVFCSPPWIKGTMEISAYRVGPGHPLIHSMPL